MPSGVSSSSSRFRVARALPVRRELAPDAPFDMSAARLILLRHIGASLQSEPGLVGAFWNEIASPERIAEPDITVFYSLLQHATGTFVLMEFVAGETIEELVKRSEPSRVESAIPLLCQILDSFDAHRRPPSEPRFDGHSGVEKHDFGIVRAACLTPIKLFGTVVFRPDGAITGEVLGDGGGARADVYPVLVAIYEKLIGQLPEGVALEPGPVSDVVVAQVSEEIRPQPRPEPVVSLHELAQMSVGRLPEPEPVRRASWMSPLAIAAGTAAVVLVAIYAAVSWAGR